MGLLRQTGSADVWRSSSLERHTKEDLILKQRYYLNSDFWQKNTFIKFRLDIML